MYLSLSQFGAIRLSSATKLVQVPGILGDLNWRDGVLSFVQCNVVLLTTAFYGSS